MCELIFNPLVMYLRMDENDIVIFNMINEFVDILPSNLEGMEMFYHVYTWTRRMHRHDIEYN